MLHPNPQPLVGSIIHGIKPVPDPTTNPPQISLSSLIDGDPEIRPLKTAWQKKNLRLDVWDPEVQALADAVELFCWNFFNNNRKAGGMLFVMTGRNGNGKTTICKRVAKWAGRVSIEAYERGHWTHQPPSVHFAYWPEVTDECKSLRFEIIEDLKSQDLVILDDVGSEQDTANRMMVEKLLQILSNRERKFTLISMNVPLNQWASVFERRVVDRMMRNHPVIFDLKMKSYSASLV